MWSWKPPLAAQLMEILCLQKSTAAWRDVAFDIKFPNPSAKWAVSLILPITWQHLTHSSVSSDLLT